MEIQTVTVADAVADELRRRLLSGAYRGGEQLRDTELATEFGVARPTVRAAVQMLVADGLLERGRGRSAEGRSFTAVELVIARKRPIDAVETAMRAFAALPDDVSWDVVAEHDVAFHRAVFEAAGSPRLLRTFDDVSAETRLLVAQLRPAYSSVSHLAHEHELLLLALRAGRLGGARRAWAEHFDRSEQFFLDLIQERAQ